MIPVLYVDDDPTLAALFRRFVRGTVFEVMTASSVPEALAILDREGVDVVVSDIRISGRPGLDLLRECRRRPDRLPFILFARPGWDEDVDEAIGEGVDVCIPKGVDPASQFPELVRLCRRAVAGRRAEEEPGSAVAWDRRIVEGSPTGIHLYELTGEGGLVLRRGNRAADRILGIEHACLVGRAIDEVIPGLRGTEVPARCREVALTGRPWHADLITYRDGRPERAFETWAYPLDQSRVVLQFVDIADRVALEEELRHEGGGWKEVFGAIGQPAMLLDPDGRILAANRAVERATGRTAAELVGGRCAEVFHGASAPPDGCPLTAVVAGGADGPVETVIEALDGTYLVSCTPVRDDEGRLVNVVYLATEITDQVRRERALQRANDTLTLISNVTRHDLRNRLMGLQGYVRMAEREQDPERRARYRRLIGETAQAMEEILAFAGDCERVGSEAPEWQQLDEVVLGAFDEVHPDGVRLDVETGTFAVLADPLLRKVFSNLMDNSGRHGGTVTRIRVSTRIDGDALVVVYEDDGVGIPRDEKELIFWKGYGQNTGLGLHLTTQILGMTGIGIRETGTFGIGARFELRCPPGAWR